MNQNATHGTGPVIRLPKVEELTGLKKTSIYTLMKTGFPTPVRIGARAVAWDKQSVLDWIASRPKTRQDVEAAK